MVLSIQWSTAHQQNAKRPTKVWGPVHKTTLCVWCAWPQAEWRKEGRRHQPKRARGWVLSLSSLAGQREIRLVFTIQTEFLKTLDSQHSTTVPCTKCSPLPPPHTIEALVTHDDSYLTVSFNIRIRNLNQIATVYALSCFAMSRAASLVCWVSVT